ncbi:MAG: ABC transporter ATP-binding protein [Candidatus Hydrogenedentes bacterium]|nr:ABC transporter ATP-binding protein [Candidatus Hydrogenedentota bacterium]
MPLLKVEDLRTYFHTREGVVRAVDGVSFQVEPGETLGIVGESGSGKSVTTLTLMGLVPMPPGRVESGPARFNGVDLLRCSRAEHRAIRGKRISMIFQDPMTALNPYMRVGRQIMEPLLIHDRCSINKAREHAVRALETVGIQDAPRRLLDYPHQFSGGMRQRVMIAMALITRPQLLIADEPTTALDVTVQAQILELIKQIQSEMGMAVILVTHDLGVIAEVCDRVLVMYAGRIVEAATTSQLFQKPGHPYTRALMASLPAARKKGEALYSIKGMPPDLAQPITGCPFAPRCEVAVPRCQSAAIALRELREGHESACIREQEGELP